ncbi:MAG TPA: hypothetical protein VFR67_15555 [Pilimelia sp.]|nr:hypothetical protein [Pilimelia sp.]
MSDTRNVAPAASGGAAHALRDDSDRVEPTGWVGWVVFAGVMLIMMGSWHAMMGFVALFDPGKYAVTPGGLIVEIDYTGWGWIHLILGGIAVLVGIGVLAGQTWARVTGIVFAVIATIVNTAFLAAYPVWTTLLIAVDVITIYALAVHGREMKAYRD